MSGVLIVRAWACPGGSPSSCRLLLGALVGAWQGFWIAYVGIPAFIVTLAGMLIFRGLALVVLGEQPDRRRSRTEYRKIGYGFLPDLFGGTARPRSR